MRARASMGEGQTTAWPGGGGEDRCSLDMQEIERGKETALQPRRQSSSLLVHFLDKISLKVL